jgi:hypothetical protein
MWTAIVGKLLGSFAPQVAEIYIEKKRLKQEIVLEKLRGKAAWEAAKTKRASESEGRDAEWELASIKNSGYKDEWVLFMISIPMVLAFIPRTVTYVEQGFAALANTPTWYQFMISSIFLAIYGIRLWRRKFGS